MSEKINNNMSIYAAAVPYKQKERLLAAYSEYISLVRALENMVKRHTVSGLATRQGQTIFQNMENPWIVDEPNNEEKKAYFEFVKNTQPSDKEYCFVSLNLSTPDDMRQGIMAATDKYGVYVHSNKLPNYIERIVAAYPKEAMLKDTRFIINGKYALDYENAPDDMSVAKSFEDEIFQKRFQCMLGIISRVSENLKNVTDRELKAAQIETLASEMTSPFENTILSALATLTEESGRSIQQMLGLTKGSNYLRKAESFGIIPSAARFQDYQNIRHLLRHQWDTLDNLGRFTFYDADKTVYLRTRFIEGYNRICGHPLSERIKNYVSVGADFSTLTTGLFPELQIRKQGESNNKFLTRLKAYRKENEKAPLLVETAYSDSLDKKRALIKNIEKFFPEAKIIDRQEMDMTNFIERIKQHITRERFLDIFTDIEYKICQFSLFSGKNQPVLNCWQDMHRWKIISPEEAEKWSEYRKLRNELSHRHMDTEVFARLDEIIIPFASAAIELDNKLAEKMPNVFLVEGTHYRAIHANGKTVDIDFKNKRVLSIIDAKGKHYAKNEKNQFHQKVNQYTEEYTGGISITINGTEITAFRMPNGTLIDLNKQRISYPNNATFYFNSAEHNSLVYKGGVKLLTDKSFRVINYICQGKSVHVSKNEVLLLPNSSRIVVGPDNCLEAEIWQDSTAPEEKITYAGKGNPPLICFSDGTTIKFKKEGAVISHAGIELAYKTRQAFAESYKDTPPSLTLSQIKDKGGR